MKLGVCLRNGLFAVGMVVLSGTVHALPISGDPVADGWSWQGNSLADGTYIRGTGGLDFDVYNQVFTLAATDVSAYDTAGNWQAGDQIIGLGGSTSGQYVYWPNLVAKFGSADPTNIFSASTIASPDGDGNGSFSSGMAGLGGIQVDFNYEFDNPDNPGHLRDGLGDTIRTPDNVLYDGPHQFTGSDSNYLAYKTFCDANPVVCAVLGGSSVEHFNNLCDAAFFENECGINQDFARVIAIFSQDGSGKDILDSFEIVLDLSYLEREGYDPVPQASSKSDMALQTFADAYTDALVSPAPVCNAVGGVNVCTPIAPLVVADGYQYDFDITASGDGDVYIPLLDSGASYKLTDPSSSALVALVDDPNDFPILTAAQLVGKDPAFADPAAWLKITENGDTSFGLQITSANGPTQGPIIVDGTLIDPFLPQAPNSSVPEPGTLLLMGIALGSLALARRQRITN